MLQGRRRNLLAAIAVVIVVMLFMALFYSFAGHKGAATTTPSSHEQTTLPASTVTDFPVSSQYSDVIPIMAPSDPKVVYKLIVPALFAAGGVLARSTDGGATWQTFSLPTLGPNSSPYSAFVSPLNPQEVFLTMQALLPTGTPGVHPCPPDLASSGSLRSYGTLAGDTSWCVEEFLSLDGGAHWTQPHLPADALAPVLGDTSNEAGYPYAASGPYSYMYNNSMMVFQTQGSRLYSVTNVETDDTIYNESWNLRLVTSTDGGLNWSYADEALVSSGKALCDYSATPSGSTLFAILGSGCGLGASEFLWRSDDAGAHWAEVWPGLLSGFGEVGMVAVSRDNGQQPLLYINMEQATVEGNYASVTPHYSPTNLQVSADGGNTWTYAPIRGFPLAQPGHLLQNPGLPLGVLSDGSVLFMVRTRQDVDTFSGC